MKKNWFRKISTTLGFSILIGIFSVFVLWQRVVYTVPPGHGSVLWKRILLTGESNSIGPIGEGVHLVWPWNEFYIYDLRLKNTTIPYAVISKEGLHLDLQISYRYVVFDERLVDLNTRVGPEFPRTLINPTIGSVAREVVSEYTVEEIYGTKRDEAANKIYENVISPSYMNGIGGRNSKPEATLVRLFDILLAEVILPETVRKSIEDKQVAEQRIGQARHRVEIEKFESERKVVEANGIKKFQEIVSAGISNSYLRWKGIDATLKLAESPNSKIVVIGNSETGGLPLILDVGDTQSDYSYDKSDIKSESKSNNEKNSNQVSGVDLRSEPKVDNSSTKKPKVNATYSEENKKIIKQMSDVLLKTNNIKN